MMKNNWTILNNEVVHDIMNISKEIEKEKENLEPDKEKIKTLMYQQLIKGMYLNTGFGRKYNPY